jgi:hypothetical protein
VANIFHFRLLFNDDFFESNVALIIFVMSLAVLKLLAARIAYNVEALAMWRYFVFRLPGVAAD